MEIAFLCYLHFLFPKICKCQFFLYFIVYTNHKTIIIAICNLYIATILKMHTINHFLAKIFAYLKKLLYLCIVIEKQTTKTINNMVTNLQKNVQAVLKLNKQMHEDIVQFLKEHNGLVRTDNTERRDMGLSLCDNIYVNSMNGDDEPNTEKRVLAVALFGEDQVAVLPDLSDNETILGMTDQEVLDCDNWEWIFGGYVLQNTTLTSICECIEEYV